LVEDFAEEWLDSLTGRRERTVYGYRANMRLHVLPFLGSKPIASVTADDIVALARHLTLQGYSAWTVSTVLTPLKVLFRHAARRGLITASPFGLLDRSEDEMIEDPLDESDAPEFHQDYLGETER